MVGAVLLGHQSSHQRGDQLTAAPGVEQTYPALVTALVETCLCCRTGIFAPSAASLGTRGKRACGLPRFAGAQLTPSTTERHRPRRAPGPPFGYFVRGQHVALHLADEDLQKSLCS